MTYHKVSFVWMIRYSMSHFKALYGRRFEAQADNSYSKDFLQISGQCASIFEEWIGHPLGPHQDAQVTYVWPGGELDGKLRRTTDRINLRWPTSGTAPEPWRLRQGLGPLSLHTFEGDPDLPSAADADLEWLRVDSLRQEPWLLVAAIDGEDRKLHIRAFLGNPPTHLSHTALDQLPDTLRALANTEAIGACRAVDLQNGIVDAQGELHFLYIDPSRNHNAFLEEQEDFIDASNLLTLVTSEVSTQDTAILDISNDTESVHQELAGIRYMISEEPQLLGDGDPEVVRIPRLARDDAFRIAVKRAYDFKCSVCGISLHSRSGALEVQAAHIYPKALNGRDDPRNGICLCSRHHWAFDAGWIGFADDLKILVHPDLPNGEEYDFIRIFNDQPLHVPANEFLRPHALYLRERRMLDEWPGPRN